MHHGEGLARQKRGSHGTDKIEKAKHRPRNRNTGRRRPDQGDHGDARRETDCDVAERGRVGEEAGKLTADLQHQEHASQPPSGL